MKPVLALLDFDELDVAQFFIHCHIVRINLRRGKTKSDHLGAPEPVNHLSLHLAMPWTLGDRDGQFPSCAFGRQKSGESGLAPLREESPPVCTGPWLDAGGWTWRLQTGVPSAGELEKGLCSCPIISRAARLLALLPYGGQTDP